MPRSGLFLEATLSFLNSVGQNALASMRATQEELRTDTFSLSKSVGRVASFWLEAFETFPTALVASLNGPLPTLFVVVRHGDTTVTRQVQAVPPEQRELEFTGLKQVGGGAAFDSSTVRVEPTGTNTGINLILTDLKVYPPEPGLYQGLVHVGDAALALILVEVAPAPPSAAGAPAAAAPKRPRRKA